MNEYDGAKLTLRSQERAAMFLVAISLLMGCFMMGYGFGHEMGHKIGKATCTEVRK